MCRKNRKKHSSIAQNVSEKEKEKEKKEVEDEETSHSKKKFGINSMENMSHTKQEKTSQFFLPSVVACVHKRIPEKKYCKLLTMGM